MLTQHWLALAQFAAVLTVVYVVYHQHVRITAGLAALSWSVLAATGGQLQTLAHDGSRVDTAVPELQLLAAAAAIISVLVVWLYPEQYPITDSDLDPNEESTDFEDNRDSPTTIDARTPRK